MTSLLYLGNTQMCERALAHDTHSEGGGGWVASGVTGRVGLYAHSITVVNPNGTWVVGVAEVSCYTSSVGALIQGSTAVDGGAQKVWGIFNFNKANDHTEFRFTWLHGLSPGAHSINVGLWVASYSINFDSNDGGTFSCWEKA